jgi:hypothetical protein
MILKDRELANIICGDCGFELPDKNRADPDTEDQTGIPVCTCKPWTRAIGGRGRD